MTSLVRQTLHCAICGSETIVRRMASSNTFGPPDLDGRPSEMLRSAMIQLGVERCPTCGYAFDDLEVLPSRATGPAQVREALSMALRQIPAESGEAFRGAYTAAALGEALGEVDQVWRRYLLAAWAADDAGTSDMAVLCRRKALSAMDSLLAGAPDRSPRPIVKVDILRRAGLLDEATARAQAALDEPPPDPERLLLSYSLHLCAIEDRRAHTHHEALEWLVRRRPPRTEAEVARDAATLDAGLRVGPFNAAHHRSVWSDRTRQRFVEWLSEKVVPLLAIDVLRSASIRLYSEHDEDRFCGPNSAVKKGYMVRCLLRGPSSFQSGRFHITRDPDTGAIESRAVGEGTLPFSWRSNDALRRAEEDEADEDAVGPGNRRMNFRIETKSPR